MDATKQKNLNIQSPEVGGFIFLHAEDALSSISLPNFVHSFLLRQPIADL
jgi:hypothetical protein